MDSEPMTARPRNRYWTPGEDAVLCELHGRVPAAEIGRRLGRPDHSVHNRARQIGIARPTARLSPADVARLARLKAEGLADAEIAAALGSNRRSVERHRRRLGLGPALRGERHRRRLAEAARRQLAEMGLATMGELRKVAHRVYAIERGWPADLRPRAVQILELLRREGPKTRREIAEGVGLPWIGPRKSLQSSDPEGTYLAHLVRRGLVVPLGRLARGRGRGRSCHVYSLALDAIPEPERSPADAG